MMREAELAFLILGLKTREGYKYVLRAMTFQASGWVAGEKSQDSFDGNDVSLKGL